MTFMHDECTDSEISIRTSGIGIKTSQVNQSWLAEGLRDISTKCVEEGMITYNSVDYCIHKTMFADIRAKDGPLS